ncbi:MAG: hypothetical protein Ct9H90mP7_4220 [Candidatus Neomarinimicrobiota bacterium]|nr:MAG: hypothetical protein Ct9H90mP7_4220 [Candidatus Neomarinimicrobiota bacterium]
MGFAKGFAYANSLPLVPISNLEIIANDPQKFKFLKFFGKSFFSQRYSFIKNLKIKYQLVMPRLFSRNQIKSNNNLVHYGCEN